MQTSHTARLTIQRQRGSTGSGGTAEETGSRDGPSDATDEGGDGQNASAEQGGGQPTEGGLKRAHGEAGS